MRTGRDAEAAAHIAAMREAKSLRCRRGSPSWSALRPRSPRPMTGRWSCSSGAGAPWDRAVAIRPGPGAAGLRRTPRTSPGDDGGAGPARAALGIFERLRARSLGGPRQAELGRPDRPRPRAGDNVLDRLTPQEFEIVGLAASAPDEQADRGPAVPVAPGDSAATSTEPFPSSVSQPVRACATRSCLDFPGISSHASSVLVPESVNKRRLGEGAQQRAPASSNSWRWRPAVTGETSGRLAESHGTAPAMRMRTRTLVVACSM